MSPSILKAGLARNLFLMILQFTHFVAKSYVTQISTEVPNQIIKCFELQPITAVLPHTPPAIFWAIIDFICEERQDRNDLDKQEEPQQLLSPKSPQ
jgi:hypothetical protein